jgi:hypothetical protein
MYDVPVEKLADALEPLVLHLPRRSSAELSRDRQGAGAKRKEKACAAAVCRAP